MKHQAKQSALQDLMGLLMPSMLDGLNKKGPKTDKDDKKQPIKNLKTQELVEESLPVKEENEMIERKPMGLSFSQISMATKKEPPKPSKKRKRKGR